MKVDGNTLRAGNLISHQDRLWRVVKTQHVKPGKGGAYMQVELKEVRTGQKYNHRFRASESVERVRLEQRMCQYLYEDGSGYHFMDQETFDQVALPLTILEGEERRFLSEGMVVSIEFHEGEALSVSLPEKVTLRVLSADAVVKGQTASSSYKPAVLENGVRTMVPPYIESDVLVVVRTSDASYVERG